jgi:hypothetical protein
MATKVCVSHTYCQISSTLGGDSLGGLSNTGLILTSDTVDLTRSET